VTRSLDARLRQAEEHTDPEALDYSLEQILLAALGDPIGEPTVRRKPGQPSLVELILAAARVQP
jgi:hypothetical protein